MKILMVCLGNICRSPMAEGIVRHKAQEKGIQIDTDSCGTSSWHQGEKPDGRAIDKMAEKGIDISDLRARQFQNSDFDEFDIIYCMDQSNYNDIINLTDDLGKREKVKLILNEVHPGKNSSVPDPYFGSTDGFENVFNMLDVASDIILQKV